MEKSTVNEIRARFDADVERFSNLETGQAATLDAPLVLELITAAAREVAPDATDLLDIGCGAGNYTLKMLEAVPGMNCTLIDLSAPMLQRAAERLQNSTAGTVHCIQGDIREVTLEAGQYDIILAGAVLHHLRTDNEWKSVIAAIFNALKPGGCFWISDLVAQDTGPVNRLMEERYKNYLTSVGGEAYSKHVMAYIEKEDSPRSVTYQLELMRSAGFRQVEILHKNTCFAAFGGIKANQAEGDN